jgi:glycosyltransferase involved in cell wall biosynthesis
MSPARDGANRMPEETTVCLVTTAQPSTNPRLVKEADALAECGYRVQVVCSYYQDWAMDADRILLRPRSWSCTYVGGSPSSNPAEYWWTRVRNGVARRLLRVPGMPGWLDRYALLRNFVELKSKAVSVPADLYIAHNIEALPAAAAAASLHRKPLGFDAEDFHSGMDSAQVPPHDQLIPRIEREFLPKCSYMTAASPGIGEAYAAKYDIERPTCILNVFPLSLRRSVSRNESLRAKGPLRLYWMSQTVGDARGLEDIIGAMGLTRNCDIELHLQGRWQPGYRERLFSMARGAGIDENRICHHPPVDPDQLVGISAGYDIGLDLQNPTDENRSICLTNKLFTYILAGNAVIAAATKGLTPLVRSLGPAGFLYQPGDIETLAAGLRKWHDDRALLQAARDHAWHLGTTRYNWDIEKKSFLQMVETVLQRPARGDAIRVGGRLSVQP